VDVTGVLLIILLVVAIATCLLVAWAMWVAIGTMRSVRALVDEVKGRLLPLLDKAEITLDAINVELLRIDAVVTRFEDVTERVTSTTHAVQEAVNAPMEVLSSVGGRFARAIARWHRGRSFR